MSFFDYYRCPCNNKVVTTNFCPYCGKEARIGEKKKAYRFEGMLKHRAGSRAVPTGETRNPRKGEYYLSGCKGYEFAYKAPNDLPSPYLICRIVEGEGEVGRSLS